MVAENLLIAGLLGVFTVLFLATARGSYNRSRAVAALAADASGGENTVEGPVRVTEPADPEREPPDGRNGEVDSPALWAWRVQEERKGPGGQGSAQYSWETIESGLAVGEFAIEDGWDEVRVDPASLPAGSDADSEGTATTEDPLDSEQFHFEDPDVEQYLGEPGLLDRLGGDYGPFEDLEFTVSVGSKTSTRDRYQAAVIEDGDEVLVRGKRRHDGEGEVIEGTDDTPLVVAEGDLEAKAERMRTKARNRLVLAGATAVFAAVVVAVPLL